MFGSNMLTCLKLLKKYSKIFLDFYTRKFLDGKNFKQLLISMLKCIEVNSESGLGSGFGSNVWLDPKKKKVLVLGCFWVRPKTQTQILKVLRI